MHREGVPRGRVAAAHWLGLALAPAPVRWSIVLVGSMLAATASSRAQTPYTRFSPSRAFAFEVDPEGRFGDGPADCRLLASGHEVWSKRLPFTFQDAAVTDDGIACGYGFSRGHHRGDLIVASVGPTGDLRRVWRTPCLGSRGPDGPERGIVSGMLVESDLDRFGLRIEDADDFGNTAFWLFALSDGRRLDVVRPDESLRGTLWTSGYSIRRSRELFGKRLRLVQWQTLLRGDEPTRLLFTLVDSDYRLLWLLPKHARLPIAADRVDPATIESALFDSGAILEVGADGRFALGLDDLRTRIEFEAEKGPAPGFHWQVSEIARSDYAPPEPATTSRSRDLPELAAVELGSFPLSRRFEDDHRVWIDAAGRFFVLDPRSGDLHAFDSAGKQRFVLRSRP